MLSGGKEALYVQDEGHCNIQMDADQTMEDHITKSSAEPGLQYVKFKLLHVVALQLVIDNLKMK